MTAEETFNPDEPAGQRGSDPLLLAGKVLTVIMQGVMALGAVALLVAIPALLIFGEEGLAEVAAESGFAVEEFPLALMVGVMLLGLVMLALSFVFFGKLRQLINTVGAGDPFAPANATRLSQMGWLALSVQLLMLPAMAAAHQLARFADEIGADAEVHISGGSGLDIEGLLLVVVLFILARVFRHGAAMREDLEGTV